MRHTRPTALQRIHSSYVDSDWTLPGGLPFHLFTYEIT